MVILALLAQAVSALPTDASVLQSAISALESDIKSLENSSIPWEHRLPRFTFVVAVGVVMELLVIGHEWWNDWRAWKRETIRLPERPSTFKIVFEVISVILVAGGIILELWAGLAITSINGQLRSKGDELRSKSDLLLTLVTQKAGNAETSSQGAVDKANVANKESSKAQRAASAAETLANSAGDKVQDVEGQTADLRSRADTLGNVISAEAKRASDIETYLRPRTISYPKGSESFDELKPFAGMKAEFDVLTEVEARRAAHEIMNVLMEAGWHSPMSMKPNPALWSGPDDGVRIEYHWTREEGSFSSDPTYKAAKALEKFLCEKQGWDAHVSPSPPNIIPANTIKVTVGFKPDRLFEPDWVKAGREHCSATPH